MADHGHVSRFLKAAAALLAVMLTIIFRWRFVFASAIIILVISAVIFTVTAVSDDREKRGGRGHEGGTE